MPGDSEHPVTVGDLLVHEGYPQPGMSFRQLRPATVADLVSALRAEGVLVVEKVDRKWPKWALDTVYYEANDLAGQELRVLDGLAEAQP